MPDARASSWTGASARRLREVGVRRVVAPRPHGPVELLERILPAQLNGHRPRRYPRNLTLVSGSCERTSAPRAGHRPFRGAGLELLPAALRGRPRPLDRPQPLRIWDGPKLAERVDELGATVLDLRGRLRARARCSTARSRSSARPGATRPTSTSPAATAAGIPVLHAPGRNADGVAEMTVALLFAVNRHLLAGRPRRPRRARCSATARSPTSATGRGSSPGRTAGLVGLGAVGRATKLAARGPRHAGASPSTPTPTTPPTTRSTTCCAESDVVSMHAALDPRDARDDGRRRSSRPCPRARST